MKKLSYIATATLLSLAMQNVFAIPAQVEIIRHGEKPTTGNTLTQQGYERAAALAPFFEYTPSLTPDAVYAAAPDSQDGSLRSIETCTPTAKALNLSLNTNYQHKNYTQMVKDIMSDPSLQGKTVLICWTHGDIPAIAAAFGVSPQPPKWKGTIFDQMYVIQFNTSSGAVSSFQIVPQQLLYGDDTKSKS